jgi:hypothetical protein
MTPSQLEQTLAETMTDILSDLFTHQEDMTPEQRMYAEITKHTDPVSNSVPRAEIYKVAMEIVKGEVEIISSISKELGRALTMDEFQQVHETVVPALVIRKGLEEQLHGG